MRSTITCLLPLAFYSCATSSMHSEAIKEVENPRRTILTLYIEDQLDIKKFDSVFYASNVRSHFNDLRTMPVRSQMERALKRNLSHPSNRVISSSDVFKVNEEIDYSLFRQKLDRLDVDAILLVNEDQYWETRNYSRTGSSWNKDTQPNSAFHCYLVDIHTGEILWLGRCEVQGVFAGYENLNNLFARRVTRQLKNNGYIGK